MVESGKPHQQPHPKTRFTGAELIVHLLERQGIKIVAGIPGGAALPLYDALGQSNVIRHILARHEQGLDSSLKAWRELTVKPPCASPQAAPAPPT